MRVKWKRLWDFEDKQDVGSYILNENVHSIYEMIDSLSEEELFKPHMRKWADEATKTAVWEVYRFIHVNTVAPFGTFRTKIRKWKKIAL